MSSKTAVVGVPGIVRSRASLMEVRAAHDGPSFFEVHWVVTRRCTYACEYCPSHRHDAHSYEANEQELLAGMTRLAGLLAPRAVRVNFTGGEPTRHKSLPVLVAGTMRHECISRCRVLSNLSMPIRVYEQLAEVGVIRPGKLQVVASYHFGSAQPAPFIARVSILLQAGIDVMVKLVAGLVMPTVALELIKELRQLRTAHERLVIKVQRVRGSVGELVEQFAMLSCDTPAHWGDKRIATYMYGTGTREEACDDFDAAISSSYNRFLGYACDAGISALFVNNEGSVHSALCKPDERPLFNLFDLQSPSRLPTTGVTCPHERCQCTASIRIPKRTTQRAMDALAMFNADRPDPLVG